MARNAPGAVRALPRLSGSDRRAVRPVAGLSSRANAAITELERRRQCGSVVDALDNYRRFVRRPGRWLRLRVDECPCPGCDPLDQRDVLEQALNLLPRAARRELWRLVAPVDEEFLRKTLPDPDAARLRPWDARAWWRQRIQET